MRRKALILLGSVLMTGCMAQQQAQPPMMAAELTNPLPAPVPVHIPPDPVDNLPPAIRNAYLDGSQKPIHEGITTIYPYSPDARPRIVVSPLHVTAITLSPNEHLVNTAIGDSDRFALEAKGNTILLKPTPPGHNQSSTYVGAGQSLPLPSPVYSTNLIAQTDKRTYHFFVQSGPKVWMEQVSFFYPEEITAARQARTEAMQKAAKQVAQSASFNADALDFNYKIKGPSVPWRPVQVFSDRSHTYLQFNDEAALAGDLPTLFTGQGKNQAVVNYTTRGNTFIADRVLTDMALASGQGSEREVVRVESTAHGN